jgi:hypothetical protein
VSQYGTKKNKCKVQQACHCTKAAGMLLKNMCVGEEHLSIKTLQI